MEERKLANFFEQYLSHKSLFANKQALQTDFQPEDILHRDEQITQVANVLAPILRGQKSNNLFIYGYPGTGKTLVTLFTTRQIKQAAEKLALPVIVTYINCKLKRTADTEYRLVAQLAKELGRPLPATGLPTDEVYKTFYEELDAKKCTMLLVLDEIDALVEKADDQLLYNLLRINEHLHNSRITLVGVSNNLTFKDTLDPRVRSSLSEEELLFPRYNAVQLLDILKQRASLAFAPGVLEDGVVQKCAALAAQDHGDARRAIMLLRTAAELCEREHNETVGMAYLDVAESSMENERVLDCVRTQPKQHQATLCAVLTACAERQQAVFTGEIYEKYQALCGKASLRPLTQRRVSDIIQEFDMLGLIQSKVISKGRYGRTREIGIALPAATLAQVHAIVMEALSIHG